MPSPRRPAHGNIESRDYAKEDDDGASTAAGGEEDSSRGSKNSKMKGKGRSEEEHEQDMLALNPQLVPTEGLEPLISYLNSLEDRPCTLLDLGLALSYASYPTNNDEQPQSQLKKSASDPNLPPSSTASTSTSKPPVSKRPPIRIWSSDAFSRLMQGRQWIIDCLTIRSQAIMREFLLELSTGNDFPANIKLEFLSSESASESSANREHNVVLVDFSIGKVAVGDLPKPLRARYPKGLAVLTGAPRRDLESLYAMADGKPSSGSQAGSQVSQRRKKEIGGSSPLIPYSTSTTSLTVAKTNNKSQNKYVHKASVAELTAFAFETFRRQPSLIADTEAGRCFLAYPWHETPLGPLSNWPPHYIGYVTMALSVPTAMIIGLGPEYLQIYNDGYIEMAGDFHPEGFGKPAASAWGAIWEDSVGPRASLCREAVAIFSANQALLCQILQS